MSLGDKQVMCQSSSLQALRRHRRTGWRISYVDCGKFLRN